MKRPGFSVSRHALFPALALLAAAGGLLIADQPQQGTTFSTDVKVVNVLATVRDKRGQIVHSLSKDDFVLKEDGRPQTIRYFTKESDLPLTLGLLVDTSLSQLKILNEEKSASYRFFDQVLREKTDLAFVIHFDFEVELLQDLTSSRKDLQAALDSLTTPEPEMRRRTDSSGPWRGGRSPDPDDRGRQRGGGMRGGGTHLYDSVLLASDELMKKQSGRKAVVVLSDGVDHGSKVNIDRAIEAAQRTDTLVYTIYFTGQESWGGGRPGGWGGGRGGWGGPRMGGGGMGRRGGSGPGRYPQESQQDGKKVLQRMAKETGGAFYEVTGKQPISKIYDMIQDDLRNQYSIGYTSDQPEGAGYRRIELTTRDKGLMVQARDGYYAQSAAAGKAAAATSGDGKGWPVAR